MRSRIVTISILALVAIMYQSCDSTLNIDKPKDFYKYVGKDGDQTGVDLVTGTDGSIYILGASEILGDTSAVATKLKAQLYLVKTNSKGEVQWQKDYGDEGDEVPADIEMLNDGNLLVLGNRTDDTGAQDIVIYTISKDDGSELKDHYNSNPLGVSDHGISITQISTGFIVVGYRDQTGGYTSSLSYRFDNDFLLDPNWSTSLASYDGDVGFDLKAIKIVEYAQDTFYIFGYSNSPLVSRKVNATDYSYFIIGVDEGNGPLNAPYLIPEPSTSVVSNDILTSVKYDGHGWILSGYSTDLSGNNRSLYIARTVTNLLKVRDFTVPSNYVISSKLITTDVPLGASASIYPTMDHGYLILANRGISGDNNLYLTKLKESLDFEWTDNNGYRLFGGIGDDSAGAVVETSDGRILVVGTMVLGDIKGQHKMVLINLNSQGMLGE